ncbi:mitochondrial 37S ribosomal protein bS1m [Kwoniella dejecticola CBS 10117]|uniref:Uncharacterized protein n=1 Tax=Kwoniella dejecticola CBS 10117 TaxID=1296121 RepID=A0A1A5ZWF7_9TREE|nr:uncharacterized protein I303_08055 [Kwoniella dejecticola CBS 10117]OBR82141.1 hypothetical protein I303_08055 [Kwoniella dejecticola CBS 10117]
MSSSTFPQLLRRANITTYDPLITRIYTSTPSSKSQHNDWGLKFSVPIKKGPRYIKFNSLDAGPGINCDWRSGEREARFVQAWGTGRVRWQTDEEIPSYQLKTKSLFDAGADRDPRHSDDYLTEQIESPHGAQEGGSGLGLVSEKGIWMKDIESMSNKQFEEYLELVRSKRREFLSKRLEDLPNRIKESLVLSEDNTLVHLASTGKTTPQSSIDFQTSLTSTELSSTSSTAKLHSKPHRVHGLSYSPKPTSAKDFVPPSLDKKGRVLNKVSRYDDAHTRASSNNTLQRGNNLPWIVSLGGITAKTSQKNARTTDTLNYTSMMDETDYTRADTSAGVGSFGVSRAEMSSAPVVLGLKDSNRSGPGNRMGGRWRQSTANQPSPLDTFKFDIDLTINSYEADPESVPQEVGSKEWVGNDSKLSKLNEWSSRYQLGGGPRSERKRGEALERLRVKEDREQTMERLNRLLGKYKIGAGEKKGEESSQ